MSERMSLVEIKRKELIEERETQTNVADMNEIGKLEKNNRCLANSRAISIARAVFTLERLEEKKR